MPRPPGPGRGQPGVQTLLLSAPRANGDRYFADRLSKGANHEQRPTPEAAPLRCVPSPFRLQGDCGVGPVGNSRLENVSSERVGGDPGTAAL